MEKDKDLTSSSSSEWDESAHPRDEDGKFTDKDFGEQVDAVLSGADTTSTHLKVMETPKILQDVGLPDLPILMTAKHLRSITQDSGDDKMNYHGLGVETVKKLPELLSNPVMVMDSLTREDSIVVVTECMDKENRPIIAAVMLNGIGNYGNEEISANILTSTYGRNNFNDFIQRNLDQETVLYVDKEKSQELFKTPGLQLPSNLEHLDSNAIIRKSTAFVNSFQKKSSN